MKSVFSNSISLSLFGESHSTATGFVLDGIAPGIELNLNLINKSLLRRRPLKDISTTRVEPDEIEFLSGYYNGHTTGTPLTISIKNLSQKSEDYAFNGLLRPSHADFTAYKKYYGYQDYRGGGHFSGRLTAPIVVAGAICEHILSQYDISIYGHIKSLYNIDDDEINFSNKNIIPILNKIKSDGFPVINPDTKTKMINQIKKTKQSLDSVGGIVQSVVLNMPSGIGEPFFHSIESRLSSLIFSVPAVKGVEFGLGFEIAKLTGKQANDIFFFDEKIRTKTNHSGGINGGISNSMPIIINTVIKPTSSIFLEQETVNYNTNNSEILKLNGRHDPAIISRATVVIESMIAIGLVDLFSERYGYLWQNKNLKNLDL